MNASIRGQHLFLLLLFIGAINSLAFAADSAPESEFKPIFNGRDLSGWRGDPEVWTVKDGVLTGRVPLGKPQLQRLVWSEDSATGDFEMRFSFRIVRGNAGVLYRVVDLGEGNYRAYEYSQLDKSFRNGRTGNIHESANGTTPRYYGRNRLANLGQEVVVLKGIGATIDDINNKPEIKKIKDAQATEPEILDKSSLAANGWQEGAIIARGYRLTHLLNGLVAAEAWDLHADRRRDKGQLMLRVMGPKEATNVNSRDDALVEFRNLRLRRIPN